MKGNNHKTQPASASDGISKGMPKGQTDKIERGNNPAGMPGVKQGRNTGEIKQGTDFLRRNQTGTK